MGGHDDRERRGFFNMERRRKSDDVSLLSSDVFLKEESFSPQKKIFFKTDAFKTLNNRS